MKKADGYNINTLTVTRYKEDRRFAEPHSGFLRFKKRINMFPGQEPKPDDALLKPGA
jgi:hypothetical protein